MLRAEKLNKYYHRFSKKPLHVIDNTTVEIPETGIIAVIGPSGAGKTTLINTLSGLDSFVSGSIAFDEIIMKHYSNHIADKLRMKNYGFIFQNYYLLEKETVYENVKIALDAFDLSETEKKKRITYVLNQLGIAKYTNKLVTSLSGGEQQRVSIARALVKSPKIIFADEPTGSLDEKTTFTVFNILKKVSETCAVFIVTHERDIISYYADYILELDNGVIVKEFTPVNPEQKTLAVDQNIYLSELEHVEKNNIEDIEINIFSDHKKTTPGDIKIAVTNGKIYLEASSDIVVLNEKSENHIVEGKKLEIKDYVNNNFEYELPPLSFNKNRFKIRDILKKSYRNYKTKNPIKNILKAICLVFSAVLLVALETVNTIRNVDLSLDLSASKDNLYIESTPVDGTATTDSILKSYVKLCDEVEANTDSEILFEARDKLIFSYRGFYQIQNADYQLPNHDFKNIDTFDSKTLTYGRVPSNPFEVVVDEYIFKALLNDSLLENAITDYGYFVDKQLSSSRYDYKYTICGVCRTKCPTIYGYLSANFMRVSSETQVKVIDIDTARALYPNNIYLANANIEPGHCLKSGKFNKLDYNYLITDSRFDTIDGVAYDLIINPIDYHLLKTKMFNKQNGFYISSNGVDYKVLLSIASQVENEMKENGVNLKINFNNKYKTQYDTAIADLNNILKITELILLVVGVIAIVLIIVSTYYSMLNQISDIAVYRSLGYSRFNLGLTYFIELALLSLVFCLAGGLLSYFVMFVLDVIPFISFSLVTSFIETFIVIAALATLITIIGVIPVMFVFRLTPAKIYSHYNKRINNV